MQMFNYLPPQVYLAFRATAIAGFINQYKSPSIQVGFEREVKNLLVAVHCIYYCSVSDNSTGIFFVFWKVTRGLRY